MVSGIRIVLATLTVQALMLLALSYLGPVHPVGDSVAVFRLQLAAAVLAGAAGIWAAGGRWLAIVGAAAAMWAAAPIAAGFAGVSAGEAGRYTLYQKNLFRKQWSRMEVMDEILSLDPDFVTLQEITSHDRRWLGKLFDAYEYKLICGEASEATIGILSRFPLLPDTQICPMEEREDKAPMRLAAAQVRLPDGGQPWLVSIHLGWPYPADQAEQAFRIADLLRALEGPVMIGGDFNMVPWGNSVQTIAKAARAERAEPSFGTYVPSGPLLPLPIDHIFLPAGTNGRTEVRPAAGSDHLGIVARFGLPASDR